MADPIRGEVWLADLGPTRGHEQSGRRPILIFSVDVFNAGPAGLVVVLPLTSTIRNVPAHTSLSTRRRADCNGQALCCAMPFDLSPKTA